MPSISYIWLLCDPTLIPSANLDYFGLESKLEERTETNRVYAIATPTVLENFPDIDECLEARAKAAIELGEKVSLKEVADKAEEAEKQRREAEERSRAIATHHQSPPKSRSLRSTGSVSLLFNKTNENTARNYYAENTQFNTESRWEQPETIAEVVEMLDFCEDSETLALIRLGSIPPEVFKVAARSLHPEKREQIRQWVVAQNAA